MGVNKKKTWSQWKTVPLSDAIMELEAGVSVNSSENADSIYRVLKTSAVSDGKVNVEESKPVRKEDYPRLKCPVKKGSIIISRMNTPQLVGECGYVERISTGCYLPDRLWQAVNMKRDEYDLRWLNYLLNLNQYKSAVRATATGTSNSMKNISKERLLNIQIPKPRIEEQRSIAELLNDIDICISCLEKSTKKMCLIREACLQHMFPGKGESMPKMRIPNFSGDWELVRYSDVADTRRGLTYKPADVTDIGVRVLRSSNINEDVFTYDIEDVFVKKEALNIAPVHKNDILITAANGTNRLVGKHAIISGIHGLAVHGGFMLLASPKINASFLNASMGSSWYKEFIQMYVAGGNGAIGNLNKNDLDNQLLLIPKDIDELNQVGEFFSSIDANLKLSKRKLKKYKLIKKGMMEELLTGKVRLM